MDFINGNLRMIYRRYLTAAFGSALISSIYSLVDMAVVGQYQGPEGTAALAVVAPIWNLLYSLGLLTGLGGSVLFSAAKGQSSPKAQNQFFTISLLATLLLSLISWILLLKLQTPLLQFFGASEALLPFANEYLKPIRFCVPIFLLNQMLAAFLRNDSNPSLATIAVLSGGIFNIFGDYYFVFIIDMGIYGAGLATTLGAGITFLVMLIHFATKRNTLHISNVTFPFSILKKTFVAGFPTFLTDISMGILTVLFNRQIMKFMDTNALAIYGVIINVSTIVQCCAYSVGQACQPILSQNYGAGNTCNIFEIRGYALRTAGILGLLWLGLAMMFPTGLVQIFMAPSAEVFAIAPKIIRLYSLSFLLLPLNIFSTYYFQSLMQPMFAFLVSVGRGLLISGISICVLPSLFGPNALWLAMPFTELIVAFIVLRRMFHNSQLLANSRK